MASDPENEERRVVIKANQYFQIERDFDSSRHNFFAWGPHQINYLHDMPFPPDKPIYLSHSAAERKISCPRQSCLSDTDDTGLLPPQMCNSSNSRR